jgi:hypothetical protein
MDPAVWASDWGVSHERLVDLRSKLGGAMWEQALARVTAEDREIVISLLKGEFDTVELTSGSGCQALLHDFDSCRERVFLRVVRVFTGVDDVFARGVLAAAGFGAGAAAYG